MQTLVLSPGYEPINRIGWEDAVTNVWLGLVEVLEVYDDWQVRSPSIAIQVPAVVRFLRGATGKKKGIRFSRENVFARDKGACQYCGHKLARNAMTYDHVIPTSRGGKTRWENVVTACLPCNQQKRNRTPVEAGLRLRSTPVKPTYLPESRTFSVAGGTPRQWHAYLRDTVYWHAELEHET